MSPTVEPVFQTTADESKLTILVIDDDPLAIEFVGTALRDQPVTVAGAADADSGIDAIRRLRPGLVLQDLVLPGASGMNLVRRIREQDPECHLVIMTGHYSTESAVEAIHAGADDYLNKPVSLELLGRRVERLLAEKKERERLALLERELLSSSTFEGIVGRTVPMLELLGKVRRIAPHFSTALVTGETGTGKELVSRALHAWSGHSGHFIVCNCASVVPTLFESELFGHKKGSFTGATSDREGLVDSANGGTLFLDELGEVPLDIQAKLLRLLQSRESRRVGENKTRNMNIRVVAATNRDLRRMVSEGSFREDLFYRLSMVHFQVPSLRERSGDVPLLIRHFMERFSASYGKPGLRLTKRATDILIRHSWPGNIRELENVLSYASMLAQTETVDLGDLPTYLTENRSADTLHLPKLADVELEYVNKVLKQCGGNRVRAADILGIGRATLYRLISRHENPENRLS